MTDRLFDEITEARHDIELEVARREERQRLEFLHRLLAGSLLPSEMLHVGSAYGLDADRQYWVFRGRRATADAYALPRHLERSCTDSHFPALTGSVEADVAGVAAKRPSISEELGLVAAIGPVPLAEIPHAWAEATRLLSVAAKYGRRGVVDSESLSIRIAVVQESELGDALYNRYVARVLAESRIGEVLLESVRVLLAEKRYIPAAAEALNVHTNTLRYRIEKFEELTGADLTDTESIIKVWWALEYWQVHRPDR
jgi:putative transposase